MKITAHKADQVTTLCLEGSFTYTERKGFQEAVMQACSDGARKIVLDLADVSSLDSAALGLLMVTHRRLCNERCRLVLARPKANVRQIIQLTNLHELIPISDGSDLTPMPKSA
ncbi:MAG TPA: STAS domain-containing protein [Nitrospiraceae bacterium]|nr:STAS domain-containing protein [Nitrospiraceae bacterium]